MEIQNSLNLTTVPTPTEQPSEILPFPTHLLEYNLPNVTFIGELSPEIISSSDTNHTFNLPIPAIASEENSTDGPLAVNTNANGQVKSIAARKNETLTPVLQSVLKHGYQQELENPRTSWVLAAVRRVSPLARCSRTNSMETIKLIHLDLTAATKLENHMLAYHCTATRYTNERTVYFFGKHDENHITRLLEVSRDTCREILVNMAAPTAFKLHQIRENYFGTNLRLYSDYRWCETNHAYSDNYFFKITTLTLDHHAGYILVPTARFAKQYPYDAGECNTLEPGVVVWTANSYFINSSLQCKAKNFIPDFCYASEHI